MCKCACLDVQRPVRELACMRVRMHDRSVAYMCARVCRCVCIDVLCVYAYRHVLQHMLIAQLLICTRQAVSTSLSIVTCLRLCVYSSAVVYRLQIFFGHLLWPSVFQYVRLTIYRIVLDGCEFM